MKLELGPSLAEIVVERLEVFAPLLEVVDESVMLEVTKVVDMPVAVLGCGGLGLGITGGTIGSVVFRAGHPEDPASRRTGQ
jgi:hypothetical protein